MPNRTVIPSITYPSITSSFPYILSLLHFTTPSTSAFITSSSNSNLPTAQIHHLTPSPPPPPQPPFYRLPIGPRRDKTCLQGFRQSEAKTSFLSYRENGNFTCGKFRYDTLQKANNNGADQTARMRRLVRAFVVRKPPKTGFLTLMPNLSSLLYHFHKAS